MREMFQNQFSPGMDKNRQYSYSNLTNMEYTKPFFAPGKNHDQAADFDYKKELIKLREKLEDRHRKIMQEKAALKMFNEFKTNWMKRFADNPDFLSQFSAMKPNQRNGEMDATLDLQSISQIASQLNSRPLHQTVNKQSYVTCLRSPKPSRIESWDSRDNEIMKDTQVMTPTILTYPMGAIPRFAPAVPEDLDTTLNISRYLDHIRALQNEKEIFETVVENLMEYQKQRYGFSQSISKEESYKAKQTRETIRSEKLAHDLAIKSSHKRSIQENIDVVGSEYRTITNEAAAEHRNNSLDFRNSLISGTGVHQTNGLIGSQLENHVVNTLVTSLKNESRPWNKPICGCPSNTGSKMSKCNGIHNSFDIQMPVRDVAQNDIYKKQSNETSELEKRGQKAPNARLLECKLSYADHCSRRNHPSYKYYNNDDGECPLVNSESNETRRTVCNNCHGIISPESVNECQEQCQDVPQHCTPHSSQHCPPQENETPQQGLSSRKSSTNQILQQGALEVQNLPQPYPPHGCTPRRSSKSFAQQHPQVDHQLGINQSFNRSHGSPRRRPRESCKTVCSKACSRVANTPCLCDKETITLRDEIFHHVYNPGSKDSIADLTRYLRYVQSDIVTRKNECGLHEDCRMCTPPYSFTENDISDRLRNGGTESSIDMFPESDSIVSYFIKRVNELRDQCQKYRQVKSKLQKKVDDRSHPNRRHTQS